MEGKTNSYLEKIAYRPEKVNQIKKNIYEKSLPYIKQCILQIYHTIYENQKIWSQEETTAVMDVIKKISEYAGILELLPEVQKECDTLALKGAGMKACEHLDQLSYLSDVFKMVENIENMTARKLMKCNVCKNDVFFTPIPASYEETWKENGFFYWNADFQLRSKENYSCPICKATDRERLMIAFLEQVQAEDNEKLKMLCIAPTPILEQYVQNREDIQYQSIDLPTWKAMFQADTPCTNLMESEIYDIIVCAHVLEHIENDIMAMGELYRSLKPQGVCLILALLMAGKMNTDEQVGCKEAENWRRFSKGDRCRLYGKRDFIERLQGVGFYVNELDRGWFGDEFYQAYGFDDLAIMYVGTKDLRLTPEEDGGGQSALMEELQQENRLLQQALINTGSYFAEQKEEMWKAISLLSHRVDNIGYEVNDPKFQTGLWYPKIMNKEETVNEIVNHKKSIARFGDGEFSLIEGRSRWKFQRNDARLAARLKEVLQSQQDHILVGLANFYGDLSTRPTNAASAVRIYMTPEIRKEHYKLLNPNTVYASADMSRNETWEEAERQKRIWEGRDCVFIEGFQTRMGVGNDLFDKAKSIIRILCPAENAFDRYEEIYREAMKQPKDKLILIALGPTASVLAYDLAMQGYQAVDIGHADLCYEWILRGKLHGDKTLIPYKYNNELVGDFVVEDIHDAKYEAQIIADFH